MEDYARMSVACPNAEENSYLMHDFGALGVELLGDRGFICFFPAVGDAAHQAQLFCLSQGWDCSEVESCSGRNWVQECADIWKSVTAGTLSLVPVLSEKSVPTRSPETIYLIPGEGFGTGHHPSTRLAIALLQKIKGTKSPSISHQLDFGTGNGILAIAGQVVFPSSHCDAIDNDACAIPNACDNARINQLEDKIKFSVSSIESVSRTYDLITANIYAEVLCRYQEEMSASLEASGYLILSGIMTARKHLIEATFVGPRWQLVSHISEDGWEAYLFQKCS